MKRSVFLVLLLFVFLAWADSALGQKGCEFNIVGTWKAVTTDVPEGVLYRFASDGTVTMLSGSGQLSEPKEIGKASYELDNPTSPKSIALTTIEKNRAFLYGKSSIRILEYTEASMTCEMPGYGQARWTRVDPNRYFIIFAARRGEFYNTSGSAFPILIKIIGSGSQIDAVGTYSDQGKEAFGPVPAEVYKGFLREPQNDSEVMLRLEINSAQYERGLKILRIWERRAQEDALLYPIEYALNNVLLVKAVTESLNQCSEHFKLYKLSYLDHEDWIAEKYEPPFIPFALFKELRRLNEPRHVRDEKFPLAALPGAAPQGN